MAPAGLCGNNLSLLLPLSPKNNPHELTIRSCRWILDDPHHGCRFGIAAAQADAMQNFLCAQQHGSSSDAQRVGFAHHALFACVTLSNYSCSFL